MKYHRNIVLIDSTEIINIVRLALSKIDPRLVEHGERVGYIAAKLCEECPDRADFDFSKLFILSVLHDVGAYKTDEIDDMVRFETEAPFDHSLFGYLFLKNTPHLAPYAQAILYHHTPYSELQQKNCDCAHYAAVIHLADRADILLSAAHPNLEHLRAMAGSKFSPVYVEALLRAEKRFGLAENIRSGRYKDELRGFVPRLDIKNNEIMDYLQLLVYAIDFRSPYTVTHTADTTIISLETGRLLGLSDHDQQMLYIGAFLHDIGKIAIPHAILEKPDKLDEEEYTIIKRHINEGEQILRGVVSDEICDIALRHHEKLNGSGYIHGLSADQLTLPQRIVAVADIVSALSQRRSYKEPYPRERVISILQGMKRDGLICPQVVDTVCANYDLILDNTEKSHDPVKVIYRNLMHEYGELRTTHNH